jgi:hypothetical protein
MHAMHWCGASGRAGVEDCNQAFTTWITANAGVYLSSQRPLLAATTEEEMIRSIQR